MTKRSVEAWELEMRKEQKKEDSRRHKIGKKLRARRRAMHV